MAASEKLTTIVSTKGQVILPKAIREQLHWEPGACLTVEHTGDGVLLKAAPVFAATRPADVFGSLPFAGPPKTLDEMEEGIAAEAKRRHARRRCQPRRPLSNRRSSRSIGACEKLDRQRGRVCVHNRPARTEWVRGVYPYRAAQAARAPRALTGLARVTLEDPRLAARGLGWRERGMDFADTLHLAKAVGCEAFVSFDRRLARAANSSARSQCGRPRPSHRPTRPSPTSAERECAYCPRPHKRRRRQVRSR